jgi:ketosteroid isomerase-like protein
VEAVTRAWRAYEGGDLPVALATLDENFVATRVSPMPDIVPYLGREGMIQMLADWVEGFDEFDLRAEEFIDANGSQVVVRMHQHAVGAKSGVPVEADFWMVHTMRDQKAARLDRRRCVDPAYSSTRCERPPASLNRAAPLGLA